MYQQVLCKTLNMKILVATIFSICLFGSWVETFGFDCASENFEVSSNFPGGNIASCEATSTSIVISIEPEDEPPINPSPWYAFLITPTKNLENLSIKVTLNYPEDFSHRYGPHFSTDNANWERISEDALEVSNNGSATFSVSLGMEAIYVSGQENIQAEWYESWMKQFLQDWNTSKAVTIGYSIDRRPIKLLETNPQATQHMLFLGRSHPPEIPGVFSLKTFTDTLQEIRRENCAIGLNEVCNFFANTNFVLIPLLNPDGVARGHWRHNLGSTDLNRDWGAFAQPETRAVRDYLANLDQRSNIRLMLDFHSTNRDVFYIQSETDITSPPNFTRDWFANVRKQIGDSGELIAGFEPAPRPLTEAGTSKNYFFRTYGIPSITFESGDNSPRENLAERVKLFAHSLVTTFVSYETPTGDPSNDNLCSSTFTRTYPCRDFWCFMVEVNKATIVSSTEQELISPANSSLFSQALLSIDSDAGRDLSLRTTNYAVMEPRLIEFAGKEISNIHIGRSRQDVHGTVRRLLTRRHWLELYEQLQEAHQGLTDLAEQHLETVVPMYTHGVPAEPSTYAHVLLAYGESLSRTTQKLQEGFQRLNRSPYGAGVGNTSSVRLDRQRLATLLGFESPEENSFDANFVSSLDYRLELASILENFALIVNQFIANTHTQQRDPWPWIWVVPMNEAASRSTSMPQKRNPRELYFLRIAANEVITKAQRVAIHGHNVDAGMHDYRLYANVEELTATAKEMLRKLTNLMKQIRLNPERATEVIERSFATSAQVAELLALDYDIPFRDAYSYSAALVDLGRSTGRPIQEFTDDELRETYRSVFAQEMPFEIGELHNALDPIRMVLERKGIGGPQVQETARMLKKQRTFINTSKRWLQQQQTAINLADLDLQYLIFDLCIQHEQQN